MVLLTRAIIERKKVKKSKKSTEISINHYNDLFERK